MKIVGLITEYNPFHKGHAYHIQKAKEVTGADAVIVVMSGDFVQRGAPAIMPKRMRVKAALSCGADIVFELPCVYATGSAEYFARGAVSLLHQLGCVDAICFGSEYGDIELLKHIASVLADEPKEYQAELQSLLKSGMAFPHARQAALAKYLDSKEAAAALEQPNNTLGIEYIRALSFLQSPMKPYTIKRMGAGYHDKIVSDSFSSASALRAMLQDPDNALDRFYEEVPKQTASDLKNAYQRQFPIMEEDFSLLLKYRLMTETKEGLCAYADISTELANRMYNCRNEFFSFPQFCSLLKTKEVTYTRISRCLIHLLLQIRKDILVPWNKKGYVPYARMLGFRNIKTGLFKELKTHTRIPVLTKLSQGQSLSDEAKRMLELDLFASDLYHSVLTEKYQAPFVSEYKQRLVIHEDF